MGVTDWHVVMLWWGLRCSWRHCQAKEPANRAHSTRRVAGGDESADRVPGLQSKRTERIGCRTLISQPQFQPPHDGKYSHLFLRLARLVPKLSCLRRLVVRAVDAGRLWRPHRPNSPGHSSCLHSGLPFNRYLGWASNTSDNVLHCVPCVLLAIRWSAGKIVCTTPSCTSPWRW